MTGFNDPRSSKSEELAFLAERAWRAGQLGDAMRLFAEAAAIEESIVEDVTPSESRVRSVLAVSAVALWYKAGNFAKVEQLACKYIASGIVAEDSDHKELRSLLQRSWHSGGADPR